MSEKQFDHIENRIREAAENSEPAFDEYAWAKMEARLDEEDNRKHRLLLWVLALGLFFIVGGSGIYTFVHNKPAETLKAQQIDKKITEEKSTQPENITAVTQMKIKPVIDATQKINNVKEGVSGIDKTSKQVSADIDVTTGSANHHAKKIQKTKKGKLSSNSNAGIAADGDESANGADKDKPISEVKPGDKKPGNTVAVTLNDTQVKKDSSTNDIAKKLPDNNITKKAKELKSSRFYLMAAIGADAPNVKLLSFKNNQITPKYGVGIGYQVNRKISLQTGFYASTKKYIAGPNDYNSKYGSYMSMVQMVKVDASCLVYDIPITIRYNVLQRPTTVYYATAGISSYIMKNEDYTYYYIRYNMPHEASKTYTGNKNLFAVFNLSAGIEKKLSPYFYIQAEPSVGIPLSGVGDGSVKLYSAALQVALKYQPAKKHK